MLDPPVKLGDDIRVSLNVDAFGVNIKEIVRTCFAAKIIGRMRLNTSVKLILKI